MSDAPEFVGLCSCGQPVDTKHGKHCARCRLAAWSQMGRMNARPKPTCARCGQPVKRHSRVYCSNTCSANARPIQHSHYRNGATAGHIAVASRALGKRLPYGAQVHHMDGNKQNNINSNLVICQDAKYHKLLHVRARVLRAGGNPNSQRICPTCKELGPITKRSLAVSDNRCRKCANENAKLRQRLYRARRMAHVA